MTNISLKDVLDYLLFLAKKNDIQIVLSDELSDSTADFEIATLRTVVIHVNSSTSIELVWLLYASPSARDATLSRMPSSS